MTYEKVRPNPPILRADSYVGCMEQQRRFRVVPAQLLAVKVGDPCDKDHVRVIPNKKVTFLSRDTLLSAEEIHDLLRVSHYSPLPGPWQGFRVGEWRLLIPTSVVTRV